MVTPAEARLEVLPRRRAIPWHSIAAVIYGLCWLLPFPILLYMGGFRAAALALFALTAISRITQFVRRRVSHRTTTLELALLDRDLRRRTTAPVVLRPSGRMTLLDCR